MPFEIDMPPRDTLAAADIMDPGVVETIRGALDDGVAVTIRPLTWLELAGKLPATSDVPDVPKTIQDAILVAYNEDVGDDGR